MDRTRSLRSSLSVMLSVLLVATMLAPIAAVADEHEDDGGDGASVLVFSATAGFRHASIPTGVAAVEDLGDEYGFSVDTTEDASQFTEENLANYDAVVWLSTTGSVLDAEQQVAFESYIQNGGGYVGIHSASDTHYDWAWYGDMVGAYFQSHPPGTQTADVWVTDQAHPSTEMLPAVWERHDEWYDFNLNPRGDVHVLATIDEASYRDDVTPGPTMGHDHPIAWCQPYDGGRSWYTAGGHTHESFSEDLFLEHMAGGILWAAGEVDGDCGGTIWDNFEKNIIADDGVVAPMALEVAHDGRVFYSEKDGRLQIIHPDTGETTTAADLDVFDGNEDGLVGIAFDPEFEENDRIYLFYAPAGSEEVNYVSRFTMDGDELDLGSEQVLLEIPMDRSTCCHTAGDIEFGPEGDLWISTGDDVDPFGSQNYTPIDERPGRSGWDAQGTSANTNDLRGKLLRITPTEDGSYTIPEGNLFEPGTDLTLPEIHSMGFRNPFKFEVDQTNGQVYLADYGPDARSDNPDRGPQGRVTWHIIDPDEPANYGWPYCHANEAYIDYDFETGESGEPFDCESGPINDSPNNTGLEQTPPVTEATVWYGFSSQEPFPMLVGGAPMGGPRYEYDPDLDSNVKWPASFDGSVVFGEWGANDLFEFNLNDDASDVTQITEMLPDMTWVNPHDFAFGPHDGALYVMEWGRSFGGPSPNSRISRIDYLGVPDPEAPQVTADADPRSGDAPLEVEFSGSATSPVGADIVSYEWDFDDDDAGADEASATHTYENPGTYRAQLSATDSDGRTGTATVRIDVEGDEPTPIPVGDLECIGDVGEVILSSDFDDGTVQGWGSVAGEPVTASDAQSRSGDYSLFVTDRSSEWMGPDRILTETITPGNAYQISAWLRLPEGDEPAELFSTGVTNLAGSASFNRLVDPVTVTDEEWTYVEGVWANVPDFDTASVKFEGTANADFYLDDFAVNEIEPGDTDIPPSDDFEGDELDGCRWDRVVRYDEDTLELSDGQLLIETPEGDIYQTPNDEPTNFILQTQPEGDWTVETRLHEELAGGFSQAGLMVHLDDDNYVKFDVIADDGESEVNRIELRSEVDGQIVEPEENLDAPDNDGEWWLRLSKDGDDFSGQVSTDGEEWIDFPATVTNAAAADIGGVGIFTLGVNGPFTTVAFDHFHVIEVDDPDPDELTVEASLDPADPDGDNDWYVSPVTISLSSNDDDAVLQWRLSGDSDWITWTEPVTVDTDGVYDVEYRAIIEGEGNGEVPDPETHEVAVGQGGFQFVPDDITVNQGDTIVYELVSGNHDVVTVDEEGTEVDRSPLGSDWGTHEFEATEAGQFYIYCTPHSITSDPDPANWSGMVGTVQVEPAQSGGAPEQVSEVGEVSFQLDQTPPETSASVSGSQSGGTYTGEATVTLDADDATSGVAETHVRVAGDEDFDVYDSPVTFTGEGSYTIEFRSADVAGNVEDWQSVSFDIVEGDPTEGTVCERHQGGATFPDSPGSGHRAFIDCLAELGIVKGYTDGTFGPRDDVSRGQLASFVVRAIELSTGESMEAGGQLFPDVGPNSTHGQAIYKLRNAGIIRGYDDGTFRPRQSVSRDQTARYVVNALEHVMGEELETSGAAFPDVAAGSQYAVDVDKLVTAGVIQGFADGTFGPREPVTRAQMTRFIGNALHVLDEAGAYTGP